MKINRKVLMFILITIIVISLFYRIPKVNEGFIADMISEDIKEFEEFKKNNKLVAKKRSKYQDIEIYNEETFGKCLYLDGEKQLCENEEHLYHETIVHVAGAYIKKIENVLIIGGGDCMTLREVMKYNTIKNVTMLEIDKDVITLSKKHFGVNDYSNDPRVKILIGDASKTIEKMKNDYDLIIIDTTELNELNSPIDSIDFMKKCKNILKNDGILVKNGNNLENYISLNQIFDYSKLIHFETQVWGKAQHYKFLLVSNEVNFNTAKRYNHKLNLKHYNFKNHTSFYNN